MNVIFERFWTSFAALLAAAGARVAAPYEQGLEALGERTSGHDRLAACLFRKAAEQGDAEAQCALGYMYEVGRGVPQNYEEAERWYLLSAAQGRVCSQAHLDRMHEQMQRRTADLSLIQPH
jgi:TPR repeat protein